MALGNTGRQRTAELAGAENGSSLIEMSLALPVLFTLMFCFMELCLAFYSRNMISECAREGTRYAMFRGASCPSAATPTCEATASQVNTYVSGIGWPNIAGGTMTVNTTYPGGSEAVGNAVKVQVTYVFPFHAPFVPRKHHHDDEHVADEYRAVGRFTTQRRAVNG